MKFRILGRVRSCLKQSTVKTLCFGHFQFGTRRAQLSSSAISWQSTICSAACTRCPLCPFQIGLGVPVFNSFAVYGARPPPSSLKVMSCGTLFAVLFHSVQCWRAQCCHKHKSDPPLCQTASEQVVSWWQSTEVDRKEERAVSIGVSVHIQIWCWVQPADHCCQGWRVSEKMSSFRLEEEITQLFLLKTLVSSVSHLNFNKACCPLLISTSIRHSFALYTRSLLIWCSLMRFFCTTFVCPRVKYSTSMYHTSQFWLTLNGNCDECDWMVCAGLAQWQRALDST